MARGLAALLQVVGALGFGGGESATRRDSATALFSATDEQCKYLPARPRQYVAYKTSELSPVTLDGDLSKKVWTEVPWTEDFVDISTTTVPRLRTRAKIRWDDAFLYVAAELEEPQIWATLREHNSVIFHDNDFEIFVDPAGSTHEYKEFEINAHATTWSLSLNKPYMDGGGENSGRVNGATGFDLEPGLMRAVKLYPEGVINDPSKTTARWTVEVAMPLAKLMENNAVELPKDGSIWRINFSRVQWHLEVDPITKAFKKVPSCQSCPKPGTPSEDNWVWSPQGEIGMHLPERWGLLQFSDAGVGKTSLAEYPEWAARSAAMAVYYAEHSYRDAHAGAFTADLAALAPYSKPPFELCAAARVQVQLGPQANSFVATVTSPAAPGVVVTVRDDRLLTVAHV